MLVLYQVGPIFEASGACKSKESSNLSPHPSLSCFSAASGWLLTAPKLEASVEMGPREVQVSTIEVHLVGMVTPTTAPALLAISPSPAAVQKLMPT